MKIKEKTSNYRNDYTAIMECEHCNHEQEDKCGYNDANYHNNVIPSMNCEECGKNRAGETPSVDAEGEKKIFVFSNTKGGGQGPCLAVAEDGTVLGSHLCSHEGYAKGDLGVTEGSRPDRHETYAKHYPDGYKMEFVPASQVDGHEGVQAAFKLNQEKAEKAEKEKETSE